MTSLASKQLEDHTAVRSRIERLENHVGVSHDRLPSGVPAFIHEKMRAKVEEVRICQARRAELCQIHFVLLQVLAHIGHLSLVGSKK